VFDNIKPIDPKWERRKRQIWIGIAIFIVVAPLLYYQFKNWPEERTAKAFLTALEEERYPDAYRLWNPGPSYTMTDFQTDWGKQSPYGKISDFKITRSHAVGTGVIITALVNNKETRIWVEKKDKSLGFPPY